MIRCVLAMMSIGVSAATTLADPPAQPPAAGEESVAELRSLVKQLQCEVDELRAQTNQNWLTEKRAEEIKGLVADVLADADMRASLLESGVTAGWDNGFFIASSDGNFKLFIGGQLQARFVYNHQDGGSISGVPVDENRSGFEMRRAKFWFKGNIVDRTWTFNAEFAADRTTGVLTLEDAGWIQKDLGNGWKVRAGQMKAPFLREEVMSGARVLAVDRSLINYAFTAGTVQGVQVGWEGDTLHVYGMFHDGDKSGSAANRAWSAEDTEFAVSGRAEWLAFGDWKNVTDFSSFRDEGSSLLIGGAVNWSKQEFGTSFVAGPPASGNDTEVDNFGLTADVTYDMGGASIGGMVVYRHLKVDATGAEMDQLGMLIRGGVFLTDDWEAYAQYEWGDLDTAGVEDLSVLTIGVNKYWAKHNLKWQNDIGYSFNRMNKAWAQDAAGWREDAAGNDGEVVIRSQIQVVF